MLSGGTTILQRIGEHTTSELTEKTYVLPDENIVTVGTERFRGVETLFQPVLLARWFHDTSFQIVMKRERRYPQRVIRQCRVVKRHDPCQEIF